MQHMRKNWTVPKGTLYEYIDAGVFEVRNIDLRRAVKYKKRKKSTSCSAKDKSYRIGHNYTDFEELLKTNPPDSIVEMDCVEGKKVSERREKGSWALGV